MELDAPMPTIVAGTIHDPDGDADIDADAAMRAVKAAAAAAAGLPEDVDAGDEDAAQLPQLGALRAKVDPDTGKPADPRAVADAKADVDAQQGSLRGNSQQTPAAAAAAAAQAAKVARAADEGAEAASSKLEPLPVQASANAAAARDGSFGIRVREGLLGAHQQQRIDHIAEQLATRLRLSHAAGGSQVQLSLKPRQLGDVTVQMQVREGVVAATILVDRPETARTMQASIDDLRRSLEQQGLSIQQFSVDVRGEAGAGGANARANADMLRDAAGTSQGSSGTASGAAAVMPGYEGDDAVTAEDVHDGDVSVLA
jgi:flagellar hook-length control protein FliK